MASTLGVLDVLGRLREESERAATTLATQEVLWEIRCHYFFEAVIVATVLAAQSNMLSLQT